MKSDIKNIMQIKSDEELIKIVTIERNDYQPLALEAAEAEIKSRNIDFSQIEKIREEITAKAEKQSAFADNKVGAWLRLAHFLIDTTVVLVIKAILTLPLNANNPLSVFLGYFLLLAVFLGYYIFMEYKFQKTIGKMITQTEVVTVNNEKPDIKTVIIRTSFRLLPFDRISFIFTKNGFHDRLSDTAVVKSK